MRIIAITIYETNCINKLYERLILMYPDVKFSINKTNYHNRLCVPDDIKQDKLDYLEAFSRGWVLGWEEANGPKD
jgi:hypothetical protein